jgi:hypothetical protein
MEYGATVASSQVLQKKDGELLWIDFTEAKVRSEDPNTATQRDADDSADAVDTQDLCVSVKRLILNGAFVGHRTMDPRT